jgi:retron-type reverse transcriptase
VADRILHRALYRRLYPFYDRVFIANSFSCRLGKGTHRALDRFATMARQASRNHRRTVWVLKCDIRKFFASIDHGILLKLVRERVADDRIAWMITQIVRSHSSGEPCVGLPLGNLTSQLFANVYLNELDKFVKHRLKVRHYIRYADDFAVLSEDKAWLESILTQIGDFLQDHLHLQLHPKKVSIATYASGVDFLGWVHFPDHRVLRTVTKRRMLKVIANSPSQATTASYCGMLKHGNTKMLLSGFPPALE